MVRRSVWVWVSAGLLCLLAVSFYASVYYYMEYTKYRGLYREALSELKKYSKYIFVDILIDYGNGTRVWYNGTLVPRGYSLFDATRVIAEVQYKRYSWGVFITEINGVSGDKTHAWLWYQWNSTSGKWEMGSVGADSFILRDGDVVSWVYSSF